MEVIIEKLVESDCINGAWFKKITNVRKNDEWKKMYIKQNKRKDIT